MPVMLHMLGEFLETLGTPDGSSPSNGHEAASRHNCSIFSAFDSADKANDRNRNYCIENTGGAKLLYSLISVRTPSGRLCDCNTE